MDLLVFSHKLLVGKQFSVLLRLIQKQFISCNQLLAGGSHSVIYFDFFSSCFLLLESGVTCRDFLL